MTGTQGDLLAEAAIQTVEEHADRVWLSAAKQIVWDLIRDGRPFSTDDVWARLDTLDVTTHEPRALGAVLRAARKAGYIAPSGDYVKTCRPEAHSRPIPVWAPVRRAA